MFTAITSVTNTNSNKMMKIAIRPVLFEHAACFLNIASPSWAIMRAPCENETRLKFESGCFSCDNVVRQPGCPGQFTKGPVALRPHLAMGLPLSMQFT
jgi:hypothetical protein